MPKESITYKEVHDFKANYCNENDVVIGLLKGLKDYFPPPILDVGAGMGDISYNAFYDKHTILLDINEPTTADNSQSPHHQRLICDFFGYDNQHNVYTVFICHSLQFIDGDLPRLDAKLRSLDPERINLVLNDNDGFMGEILFWTQTRFDDCNPEQQIKDFPKGYELERKVPFTAMLRCPDFKTLARQISYLMLIELGQKEADLLSMLESHLLLPEFTINQTLYLFKKS